LSAGVLIEIYPYDPAWPVMFEDERHLLERILKPVLAGGIHHVGSTAVPGLAAKPIIDIMAGVLSLDEARTVFADLAELQYSYAPYRPEMHWFCKPSPERRTHHLILVEPSGPWWEPRLRFRDYLRAHPDAANEYETLKRDLAAEHADDREAYTDEKTAFVERIVARADG
jgi:GrpB-like predicted nucleotidyltransferase (UPF0157 family)